MPINLLYATQIGRLQSKCPLTSAGRTLIMSTVGARKADHPCTPPFYRGVPADQGPSLANISTVCKVVTTGSVHIVNGGEPASEEGARIPHIEAAVVERATATESTHH
jgi:hypothetical protein